MNNGCLIDKLPSRTIVKQAFQFLFFRFLLLVKRVSLHILFWLAYLVQDTLLAFLWNGSRLQGMASAERRSSRRCIHSSSVLDIDWRTVRRALPRRPGERARAACTRIRRFRERRGDGPAGSAQGSAARAESQSPERAAERCDQARSAGPGQPRAGSAWARTW